MLRCGHEISASGQLFVNSSVENISGLCPRTSSACSFSPCPPDVVTRVQGRAAGLATSWVCGYRLSLLQRCPHACSHTCLHLSSPLALSVILSLLSPSHHLSPRPLGTLITPASGCPPAEAGHEGEGQEAVLQGHRQGQGDAAHRGLCRLPVGWAAQPTLHWPHREHVGVVGQQHGGEGQVVLPPRGDQAGEAAE